MSFQFEWPAWTMALLAATASVVPAGFWLARWYRATLSAATLSIAAQFAVIMAVVLPYAAETKSAEDLAEHFNRLGKVPYQVLIAEERIGSIVFYLDPDVRSGLQQGQLQTVNLAVPLEARPGARVALSPKGVRRVSRYLDLTELEYEEAGRYRLYRAWELKPQVLAVAAANAKTTMR